MEWANLLINATVAILAALGGAFGTWIVSLYKEHKSQALASNDQAVAIYRELFEKVNKKVDILETLLNEIEKSYFEVKEENFRLKIEKEIRDGEDHNHISQNDNN